MSRPPLPADLGADRTKRTVTRDVRLFKADRPRWDHRDYLPMAPREEREHLVKHVLSTGEAWADLTGMVTRFDDGWHAFAVTLKEKKRDPQIRVFRERYRGLPAAKMARHLVVSEAAAPWSLALQALEPGAATEAEAAQLGELRAGLEAPRLLDQLAPFIEELATARSLLSSHPGFSRDFSRLQLELFGPVPAPFAGAALLVLLEDDADRRVDEEMERLARSVCDDPDGILAAYRRVIDDSIRAASESPRHCAYLYGRSGVSSEAYLGRSGVIVCLQRKGGGFRVSTCYRSEQGRLDRERSLETARTFRKKTHLTDWKLHTAEAWGELR